MKKKNIIWLCANIAVFALFAFFHSVKFRGEHRTFDIRYVPRTHGEHLVRADGAGGTHDF